MDATTLTEYHFVEQRRAFETRLMGELLSAAKHELSAALLFQDAAHAVQLFIKYVCENRKILPDNTLERLADAQADHFYRIAGAYLSAALVQAAHFDQSISPESVDQVSATLAEVFGENISAWQNYASEAADLQTFALSIENVFYERANELLRIPAEWWNDKPDDDSHWRFMLRYVYNHINEENKKALKHKDPLVRCRSRLDFFSQTEFVADLYRQRAEDIPKAAEREVADIAVNLTLTVTSDALFLEYQPQAIFEHLPHVKNEDLLRICGFTYLETVTLLKTERRNAGDVPSLEYATWLFGISDEHIQSYATVISQYENGEPSAETQRSQIAQLQDEYDHIFAGKALNSPHLTLLGWQIFQALCQRLNIDDDEEQHQRHEADLARQRQFAEIDREIRAAMAAESRPYLEEKAATASEHLARVLKSAREEILCRAKPLLNKRDYVLLTAIAETTSAHLHATAGARCFPFATYQTVMTVTTERASHLLGLAYLHAMLQFATIDRRDRHITRLLEHVSQIFGLSETAIQTTKELAEKVRTGTTSLHDVISGFVQVWFSLFQHADSERDTFLTDQLNALQDALYRLISRSKQARKARTVNQLMDRLVGCLQALFILIILAICAFIALGVILFLTNS